MSFRLLALGLLVAPAVCVAQQTQVATNAPEKAADPLDRVVCKKFLETGSLVKGTRVCKTKREWERERENLRQVNVVNSCGATANGGAC